VKEIVLIKKLENEKSGFNISLSLSLSLYIYIYITRLIFLFAPIDNYVGVFEENLTR